MTLSDFVFGKGKDQLTVQFKEVRDTLFSALSPDGKYPDAVILPIENMKLSENDYADMNKCL